MARLARIVAAGYPHHVIQRGNRRENVFFDGNDKAEYLKILKEQSMAYGLKVLAYCLMDNHVHFVVVPKENSSLSKVMGETHKRYTRMINFREKWRGYLWQGRFKSFVMDEGYLYSAMRYVENNPVRAKMVKNAWDYKWSSAMSHALGMKNELLSECYLQNEIDDWKKYLREESTDEVEKIRNNSNVGRPMGTKEFVDNIRLLLGREVVRKRPEPKPKGSLN